jgi:tetratricopeptide (TPR) repeat protein
MVAKQSSSPTSKLKFDISALVDKARGIYGKSDAGLAKQISSGSNIVRPEKDTDFVLWTKGDHWQKLTGTRGLPFGKIIQIAGKPEPEQKKILNEGITYLKKAVTLTPYFADGWDQMGLAYLRLKDLDSARYAFRNALIDGSNDPKINNNYGNLLFNTNQLDSALFYFEKAVSLKADYTDALNNIGSVYGNSGQFQKVRFAISFDRA